MPPLTANPNAADPLANLRDIQLPADVAWWPPAPGWWLLGLLILLAVLATGWYCRRRYRQLRYRRAALAELKQLLDETDNDAHILLAINRLLKRTALVAYPAATVASLHGQRWADFRQASLPNVPAPANLATLLGDQLYDVTAVAPEDIQQLVIFARKWLAKHRPAESVQYPREMSPC